jgi:hypothetical protein
MSGAVPPLPIRLHGVVFNLKKKHRGNFIFTFIRLLHCSPPPHGFHASFCSVQWCGVCIEFLTAGTSVISYDDVVYSHASSFHHPLPFKILSELNWAGSGWHALCCVMSQRQWWLALCGPCHQIELLMSPRRSGFGYWSALNDPPP